jgi:hypothetical protein
VALKTILAGAYASSPDRARFQREAEAVAALRHPNVVQVYDSGEAGGRPYFTMEFVEGGTLADKLAGTPLPVRPAADLVAALAGGFQEALLLLERSLRAEPRPGAGILNQLWLSLVCGKLGRGAEARRWLDQASDWLARQGTELPADARASGLHLHNWLEAHVLRREAAEVLRAGP